ncbi:MAG: HNH nuclease family protein [Nitrospiraceae bacterium]|nr:MAG: HNH nuclease family protein [Nitrospiraceae bacterium]
MDYHIPIPRACGWTFIRAACAARTACGQGTSMRKGYRGSGKPRWPQKKGGDKTAEEILQELRSGPAPAGAYRDQSLRIHGLICAKCGREFDHRNSHLLTVHHRDGNRFNNPPDGSNWENLCIHCHDDEHSRGMLGDYLSRK